nr:DUF4376 domain-containing protein [Vogesella sp. AC12]
MRDGQPIFDTGFTHQDVTYPPGWMALATTGERAALGIIEVPEPPSSLHAWDGEAWTLSAADKAVYFAARRTELLAAITAERDQHEEAGFPYRGKLLDSTPRSVQRITAAALAAQTALAAGQPFSLDWTCADNSTLSLDAVGVIGMPVALAQHAAALHAHARNLKAAVEAAMDDIALAEIDIQAGWPGGTA